MTRPNLLSQISALAPRRRHAVIASLLLLGFVLATVFATSQSGTLTFAWWWPAVGAGAAAALSAAPRHAPMVIAVAAVLTASATALAGRPLPVVAASMVGTAAEIAIMVGGLTRREGPPRLSTTRDVGRFLATSAIAATVVALLLAGAAAAASGGDFVPRFVAAGASHLSALVLIVPLVLIDRSSQRVSPWGQTALLTGGLVVVVMIAFGPFGSTPLSFLPVPLLAWAAFSQSMFVAMGQVLVAVSLASILTVAGNGPFAQPEGLLTTGPLLQIYAVAISATCLFIAVQRAERQALEDRQDALLRLLRDAFARSRTGFVVVQVAETGRVAVLEANEVAADLLTGQLVRADGAWRIPDGAVMRQILREAGDTMRTHESEELGETAIAARFWIDPIVRPELGRILLVTVEDLRPVRAVEQALTAQLDRERHISEALRDLNEKQDAFVASVSHELRTPITSIVGYAQELEESITDSDQRAYLDVITRNADRLSALVANSLRAATMSQPSVGIQGATIVDLARVVDDCLTDLRYRIDDRALTIQREIDGPIPVRANEAELGQIVSNLLTNAIKFSPAGAAIGVVAAHTGHVALLEIADAGPGISEQEQARVFERFYRSPQAVSDGVPGSGIGLSVAQALAGAMGGAIVLSERDAGGTLATLRLPLSEQPLSAR